MSASILTLGERWRDHYLAGMMLIHMLLGQDVSVSPKGDPTPETLVQVFRDIARGSYQPANYFNPGGAPRFSLVLQPPSLAPGTVYLLIGLNALTARGQFVSTRTGGIIFEDPVWAILAAHAISKTTNPRLALPKARDNEELWKNMLLAADAVRQGTYKPQNFFGPITGFIPPATAPNFGLRPVASDQIAALRTRGAQALKVAAPPEFFELFERPTP